MDKNIVIKVWRGIVTEVYADDPDLDVTVIDEDVEPDEEDKEKISELPAHKVYG